MLHLSLQVKYGRKIRFSQHIYYCNFNRYLSSMTGTIKKLTDKGFGFITGEGLSKDLFFHGNALVGVQFSELHEGDAVTFETEESPKGMNAVNVKRA